MIDRVRGVVLSILKKENRGWITPEDFNRFADLSQLEIFEDYFYEYNRWLQKYNRKMSHSGIADMPKLISEKISAFLKLSSSLTYDAPIFEPPSDYYRIETVYYNNNEVDRITDNKLGYILQSSLVAPTATYPVYIRLGENIRVYPDTITSGVTCYYIRRPLTPKWTYTAVMNNPVFNIGAGDYQDFEIHPSDEPRLVSKILEKAGVSIREEQIINYTNQEQQIDLQKKNN